MAKHVKMSVQACRPLSSAHSVSQLRIALGVVAVIQRPAYIIGEVRFHRRAALRPSCSTRLFMNDQDRRIVRWESVGQFWGVVQI